MPQFCSHMGSKCMQCWVTSVISKRFAMLGSMLWVVFVVRSLCSFCESSILFQWGECLKIHIWWPQPPVGFLCWGCPSFRGLLWPAFRQTPAHWGTRSNRNSRQWSKKKGFACFLGHFKIIFIFTFKMIIFKIKFLPSLLVVRVVTPCVQLTWAFVCHVILKSFLCQVASEKMPVEEEQLGRNLKDDNKNGQFVWSFRNLVIFPRTCLRTLRETADTRG